MARVMVLRGPYVFYGLTTFEKKEKHQRRELREGSTEVTEKEQERKRISVAAGGRRGDCACR
jgi:hypothetical protein